MSKPEIRVPDDTEVPLSVSDPAAANAAARAALNSAKEKFPDAPIPDPDLVNLPGGLVANGKVIRTAIVRELTGADEEKIFRALGGGNIAHLMNVVLECGTVRLGDLPEKATNRLLKELVIGDREAILLGIRCATYGDEAEIAEWACPECGDPVKITLSLRDDIETVTSEEPAAALRFDVPLRKGGKAIVRLPNGEDQEAAGEDPKRNVKERATILLQRCVEYVEQPNGTKIMFSAFPSYALQMGIMDRQAITEEIARRQPRPKYDDIKFIHDSCGKEVSLALDLAEQFLR